MKIDFTPPKGFAVPEGTEPGADFDLVCTFHVEQSTGKLCLTKLGDLDVGYKEGDSKPGYGEYSDKLIDGMRGDQ
jgi:hypothetical protein